MMCMCVDCMHSAGDCMHIVWECESVCSQPWNMTVCLHGCMFAGVYVCLRLYMAYVFFLKKKDNFFESFNNNFVFSLSFHIFISHNISFDLIRRVH